MKTEVITVGLDEIFSKVATAEEISGAFKSYRDELRWLAGFLTGNDEVAEACVIDASGSASVDIATAQDQVLQKGLIRWTRVATIRSAIEIRQWRISELAVSYERRTCAHRCHPQVAGDLLDSLIQNSDALEMRLDILSRFALILCGVEKCTLLGAALLLGVSSTAVEAAYCAALECLESMYCQMLVECCAYAAVCN